MEQKKKPFNKGGRKPKLDPRTHRYSLNLDDVENAKFLAFYDQSGYKVKAHFIKNCIFGKIGMKFFHRLVIQYAYAPEL